jgi:hypothetical protein
MGDRQWKVQWLVGEMAVKYGGMVFSFRWNDLSGLGADAKIFQCRSHLTLESKDF